VGTGGGCIPLILPPGSATGDIILVTIDNVRVCLSACLSSQRCSINEHGDDDDDDEDDDDCL